MFDEPRGDASDIIWRSERVCGLNCLYLLLRCEGKLPDYVVMQESLLKQDLTSLFDLKNAAAQYGLDLLLAKLTPEELRAVSMPVIAHLEVVQVRGETTGHFVVVTHADQEHIRFIDGTTVEARESSWRDFQRDWSGFVAYREHRAVRAKVPLVGFFAGLLCGGIINRLIHRKGTIPTSASKSAPPMEEVPCGR